MKKKVELLNSCELSMSIAALANALACRLSDDDLELVSAALTQLGDTLTTISVQRALCSKKNDSTSNSNTNANTSTTSSTSTNSTQENK